MTESEFTLKAMPPRLPREALERQRLQQTWDQVHDRAAIVIAAPAGFGKTTLLLQWRRRWMEHGALAYHECVADDVKPGKVTSFPQAVKLKDDETVLFSWIVYKSRRDRDRINKLVMADPRLKMDANAMPFDGTRMFWGGFKEIVTY